MHTKLWQAMFIGGGIWLLGAVLLILFGGLPFFPTVAPFAMFLAAPTMYVVTTVYLRDVQESDRVHAGLRLAIVVAAVQCPLDAVAFLSIFKLGYPRLSLPAQQATVFAIEIGYFFVLVVPWWVSASNTRVERSGA